MNINSITKHYDKLSTVERFKLLNAALQRGDDSDRAALQRTAPRKVWSIPITRGLVEAFDFLAAWHVMTMQELNVLYSLLLSIDELETFTLPDGHTRESLWGIIQRRALARDAAWREVCKEYSIDADKWIADYPGAESVRFFVDVMKRYNELAPVDFDPAEYIADLRGSIEHYRKMWE